jgi:alpha-L-fucosidase 2
MYQFEAASGIPAAIMEMLLYSEPGTIKLLPALPRAWPEGCVKGLLARGGFEVDIHWKEGKLDKAVVRSLLGKSCKVRYGDKVIKLKPQKGRTYQLDGRLRQK